MAEPEFIVIPEHAILIVGGTPTEQQAEGVRCPRVGRWMSWRYGF
jgi:hypothetical protein